jgi:AAA ATPase-like protein
MPALVNRVHELRLLNQWLQEAAQGRPRIVLMDGDAGIGKTRLLQELRAAGQRSGMQICFGRCYEDLSLPYLPFFESLLPQLEQAPPEIWQTLGGGLETIPHLLRREGATATAQPSVSSQADHEKLQLFVAVVQASIKLAQSCPMLLVLDDLHWADRLSLDLFDHLAFTVVDTATREAVPLLVVATYRPVTARDRLARLIGRIRREEICRILTLDGLSEPEVHDLITGFGLARPSRQLTTTGRSEITYSGLDLAPEGLALSRRKYDRVPYYGLDVLAPGVELPDFDYVVMNGVFTERRELPVDEMLAYMLAVLETMFARTRVGLAVNVMSAHLGWELPHLFHLSFDRLAAALTARLTRNLVVRADYGLPDYTVYLYR